MAILKTCFTNGCGIKTLGKFCLDCETAAGVAEPAALPPTPAAADRVLTPAT
jgi:hypothetical protein